MAAIDDQRLQAEEEDQGEGADEQEQGGHGGSEGNVVFEVVEAAASRWRGGVALGGSGGRRCARPLATVAGRLAAKHLHAVAADLGGVAVLAFLVLPLAGADRAFDVDLAALLQVLAADLGLTGEEADPMPLGGLLLVAVLVFPDVAGGQAQVGHGVAVGQVAQLGIGAEVADEDDFVDGCHVIFQ